MHINVKAGRKMIKDTFYTLTPLNWLLRILALSNVKRKHNNLVHCWSLTESLIVLSVMLTLNIFFLVNKVQRFEHGTEKTVMFSDSVQMIYLLGFFEYITDLYFVFKTRRSYLKYLKFYANIDKILGVPNFTKMRTRNLICTASLTLSLLISSTLDYMSWIQLFGWLMPTLYLLDYVYIFINALTVIDVVSNVIQIECRLKIMLGIVEDCYASSLTPSDAEVLKHWVFNPAQNKDQTTVARLKTVSLDEYIGVQSLSKSYVLLIEQVTYINKAYGIRLGAYCLNLLINLIHLTNIVIRIALGYFLRTPYTAYQACLQAATTTLRIINYSSVFLILVYQCEQTYKQCVNIIRLIDLTLVDKKIPSDLRVILTELRNLVLSRPIQFHAANFVILNYPLVVSVASVVVTYTIILLQSMQ